MSISDKKNHISGNEKVVFVGDIHGNLDVFKKALDFAKEEFASIVFVGDYIDSFPNSRGDQEKCLEMVKELHKDEDKYFLRGNHENGYLNNIDWGCSGYSSNFHRTIASIINSIDFLDYVVVDSNILVTHAGLSKVFVERDWGFPLGVMDDEEVMLYCTKAIDSLAEYHDSSLYSVGYDSGGGHPSGGIFWCRPANFEPIGKNIVQIFGHTKGRRIRSYASDRAFCIDCIEDPLHDYQVLLYDPERGGHFEIVNL